MAEKTNRAEAKKNRQREEREVATKLRNLGPMAQAEVVNDVISRQVGKQLNGFTNFLREQSVIGIGIGLVLGTQLKSVVDSVTNGLVLPLTQLVLPNQKTLVDQTWVLHVAGRGSVQIEWGNIAYTIFNFVVVAFIVYAIFKLFKLDRLAKKK
ncbi:MAG TPA: MscL family protein [Patescibacteria group bacterium]|nr:MscL family protein [Patescibacteria group bacterium]